MISFLVILQRFLRALWLSLKDPEFQALFFLVVVTLASGALFYSSVEDWSLLDSLYFSVITLTTVGYDDFYPSTTAGKIFTMIYLFVGISLILGFLNAIAERSMEQRGGMRRQIGRRARGADSGREEDSEKPDR
jgi:voltage-gated potassium channel